MQSTIEVNDIAAVHRLSIPLPPNGGVVVLRGGHGVGKSNTLKALDALTSGRGMKGLPIRDGAVNGEISGLGIRLTVGKRTARSGELEVSSLEGRLSIADLVDPRLKTETAADEHRVRSLVQLAGVAPNPSMFHPLLGGPEEFAEIVPVDRTKTEDILVLADNVKRAIEAEARKVEGQANTERGHAAACGEAGDGIDLSADIDPNILQSRLESAIRAESDLNAKRTVALAHNRKVESARSALGDANKSEAAAQLKAARDKELGLSAEKTLASNHVDRLEQELAAASKKLAEVRKEWESAKEQLALAESNAESIAEYERLLQEAGAPMEVPSPEIMDQASLDVGNARRALEAAAVARAAKQKMAKRDAHNAKASDLDRRAESLRGAAAKVDSVLSNQIGTLGCALRVEKGRLVTDTHRGVELFSDLSEGERWQIAIEIAARAVGPGGIIPLPQVAFEGLNRAARAAMAANCVRCNVTIITAEVTDDDELTAEVYEP